jgi:hypothetical protein
LSNKKSRFDITKAFDKEAIEKEMDKLDNLEDHPDQEEEKSDTEVSIKFKH